MPLVKIEIIKGQSAEYKTILMQTVHGALVDVLSISADGRNQRLYELDEPNFLLSPDKTEKFTLIELTLFPGRSNEIKKSLIEKISNTLTAKLDIQAADIFIVIHEPPLENWGIKGLPANEVNSR